MRGLFRSFERSGLEYLLISGQASVLYGAATFSEDIDLWVRPTTGNLRRLLRALAGCRARVYKLTPPLEVRFLRKGHAFHFVVPSRPLPVYLDVMGRPPRVGSFEAARRRARRLRTRWGTLPVVSIEDLVRIKATRRLSGRAARPRTSPRRRILGGIGRAGASGGGRPRGRAVGVGTPRAASGDTPGASRDRRRPTETRRCARDAHPSSPSGRPTLRLSRKLAGSPPAATRGRLPPRSTAYSRAGLTKELDGLGCTHAGPPASETVSDLANQFDGLDGFTFLHRWLPLAGNESQGAGTPPLRSPR